MDAELDLNLLRLLHVILVERSVTRAARRLKLSQPATSNGLARLRAALADPLVVSTKAGMVPTARGAALEAPLRRVFEDLERALAVEEAFDPSTATRKFSIAASDYGLAVLAASFARRLSSVAPGVDLDVLPLRAPPPFELLEDGSLDLVVGFFDQVPDRFYAKVLFRDVLVTVARRGHPRLAKGLGLEVFLELLHVQVAPQRSQAGLVDDALAEQGLRRRVVVRMPHFWSAPLLVAESDYLVTMPARLAARAAELVPLEIHAAPLALPPVTVSAVWHHRHGRDDGHRWLRAELARSVPPAPTLRRTKRRRAAGS